LQKKRESVPYASEIREVNLQPVHPKKTNVSKVFSVSLKRVKVIREEGKRTPIVFRKGDSGRRKNMTFTEEKGFLRRRRGLKKRDYRGEKGASLRFCHAMRGKKTPAGSTKGIKRKTYAEGGGGDPPA